MSIVSRRLDQQQLPAYRRKAIYTFPQSVDDNNDVKPPDFAQPATRGGYETRTARNIMRPNVEAPAKPTGVPLKCDQVNSHAMGASLFNAPVYGGVKELESFEEIAARKLSNKFEENDMRYRKYKPSTEYAPHLRLNNPEREFEQLVRSYRMPTTILATPISEPTAAGYRPEGRH